MFDAHLHLQDPRLAPFLPAVEAAALQAGVTGCCCCGTSPGDWDATARAAAGSPFVAVPAFGVHPWYSANLPEEWLCLLRARLDASPVAALGEAGLDGLRSEVPLETQESVLKAQLALAAERGLGVVLHGARAWGRLADALEPFAGRLRAIILHGFGASPELTQRFLSMGAFLSIGGAACNPAARKVRAAAAAIPAANLLIETDSPDLFPPGGARAGDDSNGKPLNQPSNLRLVLEAVAALRGVPAAALEDLTGANARRAFLG